MQAFWLLIGAVLGGFTVHFFERKTVKEKEQVLDEQIKGYRRLTTQVENFFNYNGTSEGQEDVDEG